MTNRSLTEKDVNEVFKLLPVARKSERAESYTSTMLFDGVNRIKQFVCDDIFFNGRSVCGMPLAILTVAVMGAVLAGVLYSIDPSLVATAAPPTQYFEGTMPDNMHFPKF